MVLCARCEKKKPRKASECVTWLLSYSIFSPQCQPSMIHQPHFGHRFILPSSSLVIIIVSITVKGFFDCTSTSDSKDNGADAADDLFKYEHKIVLLLESYK